MRCAENRKVLYQATFPSIIESNESLEIVTDISLPFTNLNSILC